MFKIIFSFLVLVFLNFGCIGSKEYGAVYFKSIASGTNAGFSEKYQKIIYTKKEFDKLWIDTYSNYSEKPKPPEINFDNQMVAAVYFGFFSSGGASIKITDVSINDFEMKIEVLQTLPGINCVTTDVITYPFEMVVIPKYEGKINFNYTDKKKNCP